MTHNTDPIKTIEEIVPCTTGCGSNADPADGFGYCTCGAEEQRKAINNELLRAREKGIEIGMGRAKTAITVAMNTGSTTMHELRAVLDKEIKWWQDNPAQLKQSQTEDPNTSNEVRE